MHRQVNFTETLREDNILLNRLIDEWEVCLVNIYAPSEDDLGSVKHVFKMNISYSSGLLLMREDFHCVMSESLDW